MLIMGTQVSQRAYRWSLKSMFTSYHVVSCNFARGHPPTSVLDPVRLSHGVVGLDNESQS